MMAGLQRVPAPRAAGRVRQRAFSRFAVAFTVVSAASVASTIFAPQSLAQHTLPARLSDSAFWALSVSLSEPNGFFPSDNFLSNEATWQHVIPRLVQGTRPGGVYLGVGPEQNFTYIAAMRPAMVFIFDIRRGNLLTQMLYKGLFEMAPTRAEFVSRLFSRPTPPRLDTIASVAALFQAVSAIPVDSAYYRRTMDAIRESFTRRGFALSAADWDGIEYILGAMYDAGPRMDYNYPGNGARGGQRPTYAGLMTADDGTGVQRSFLATEENYRLLREMQSLNLIVPVVGDFAGPRAVRAVADYLRSHNATATAFYTSNVEQYLFQQGDAWRRFYDNVATLPIDSASTFIRSYFPGPSGFSQNLLNPIGALLAALREGRIRGYADVIGMSR